MQVWDRSLSVALSSCRIRKWNKLRHWLGDFWTVTSKAVDLLKTVTPVNSARKMLAKTVLAWYSTDKCYHAVWQNKHALNRWIQPDYTDTGKLQSLNVKRIEKKRSKWAKLCVNYQLATLDTLWRQRATHNHFLIIISIISGMMLQKFAGPLLGGPFCGAPVRPNMLNMPKSATDSCMYMYADH